MIADRAVMCLEELPTPCYVLDEGKLKKNLEILEEVQADTGCRILLAQKAFAMFCEYPLIGRYLAGTTASGLYEARLGAEEMGGEVHVYAPAYREQDMDELVRICDHITFNSFAQLEKYRERCLRAGLSIGLRINPCCSTQEHAIYDPCAPGSRLGITRKRFEEALRGAGSTGDKAITDFSAAEVRDENSRAGGAAEDDSGKAAAGHSVELSGDNVKAPGRVAAEVRDENSRAGGAAVLGAAAAAPDPLKGVEGLHFHTLCEQDSDALEVTLKAVEEQFGEYLRRVKWLNMGGGHHITRPGYDIAGLERCIRHVQDTYGVEVYLEPGEAIALDAGYLVTSVLDSVENSGITTLVLDASAACHMPDVLEMPYRPPLYGSGLPGEKPYTYRLSSYTCLAGDIIGDYSFDAPVKNGDRLYFQDMAIYSMVKNNTFNGIPLPSIAVMEENGDCRIVKTFGYGDFRGRLS